MHYRNGRDLYIPTHDNGAGALVDHDSRLLISLNLDTFDGRDELCRSRGEFFWDGHRYCCGILRASHRRITAELPIQGLGDPGRGGEVGLLQLQPNLTCETGGRRSALNRRAPG